jgi:UDP-2,3-diacylglucosamine pyrophosphatase LpxH
MSVHDWNFLAFLRSVPPKSENPPFHSIGPAHHRTIFISDVHLGSRGCKAEMLADFLACNACDKLYLVGDIIDGWQLKRRWYWTQAQTRVVHEILRKADNGTQVFYIPGNHDEFLRRYCGRSIAGIAIVKDAIHEAADGKRYLVLHGDQFDSVIGYAKWLAHVGDWAYCLVLGLNDRLYALRKLFGRPYWSLSAYLKQAVKNAVEYVSRFEDVVARAAVPKGVDGVICGHIHHAEIRRIGPVLYLNDGDWVESCTAVVEDERGTLEILRWSTAIPASAVLPATAGTEGEAALIPA